MKKSINKILTILALTLFSTVGMAQTLTLNAIKQAVVVDKKKYVSPEYKGKSYVFSLGIAVNSKGLIDTIVHSESPLFSTNLIDMKKVALQLKSDKNTFTDHKNKFLFILVHLKRGDDIKIKSPMSLDKDWVNLITNNETVRKGRKITFLDPILIVI